MCRDAGQGSPSVRYQVDPEATASNMAFVRLRVAHTIESGFDHLLQLSHFSIPCALFFVSIAVVCVQLHVDTLLLRDIKGLSGE